MIEETEFSKPNVKVILSALFVPAVLYFFVVFAMAGLAPWGEISGMSMPEPELVAKFGLPGIIAIAAIFSGVLHALTTLMGFWTSSARVLYGAAQLNQLPKFLIKLNKYGQPHVANLFVLLFSVFFILFTGTNWVQYIYAVSCIAAGIVYSLCCLNVIVLRRKHPDWERPYKAPGGEGLMIIGILVGIWIIIGSSLELDLNGYISLAVYFLIGIAIDFLMGAHRASTEEYKFIILTPEDRIRPETSSEYYAMT